MGEVLSELEVVLNMMAHAAASGRGGGEAAEPAPLGRVPRVEGTGYRVPMVESALAAPMARAERPSYDWPSSSGQEGTSEQEMAALNLQGEQDVDENTAKVPPNVIMLLPVPHTHSQDVLNTVVEQA